MKKQLFSFLFLITFVISVSAQTATKPETGEQNLRKHVSYLASDKLEGRRTGEKGATFAAGYVANMFSNYRLRGGVIETKNGKSKAGFLQSFPYAGEVTLGKENRLMVTTQSNNEIVNLKSNWIPFAASPDADIPSTEAVFAGFGIVSSEQKRDDYAGKEASGKVVYVFNGTGGADNPHSPLSQFSVYTKAKIAKDRGAIALVVIVPDADFQKDEIASFKYDPTLGETAIPVVWTNARVGALMFGGEDRMRQAETGAAGNPRWVKTQIKINLERKSSDSYNVVGVLPGNDPFLKNEAIIIGAHYDHLGRGGQGSLQANSTEIHHGADDNASGVAAMLELARQFSQSKNNKRTIIFIAFGGEEEGLIGSKYYVNNAVFPLDKTAAMINLDMVGRLNQNKLTIGGIGTASEWKNLVNTKNILPFEDGFQIPDASAKQKKNENEISESTTISSISLKPEASARVRFSLQLNEDGFGPSDHSSFYSKQIPVLFFFTGTHLDYHKPTDTAEKINYAGLNRVVNYVSEIAKAVDQNPKRPTYMVAKSSGTAGGRTGFNVSLGTIPAYADSNDGLVLDGVRDNSPAAKAGLKAGDKVIKLAGKEVRNVSDYTIILGEMKADVEYEIVVIRSGQTLNLKIIPAARK